jgi:hypothetical protein
MKIASFFIELLRLNSLDTIRSDFDSFFELADIIAFECEVAVSLTALIGDIVTTIFLRILILFYKYV